MRNYQLSNEILFCFDLNLKLLDGLATMGINFLHNSAGSV